MTGWLSDGTLLHLREVADWPQLGERYEVTGRLGQGGMGVVYAAHDRTLDRDVAVKVLYDGADVNDATGRLLAEARVLGRLEHPGIVPVHDAGVCDDGRVFYVMKLVRGERLDRVLAARSLRDRLELYLRVCDTVAFAHAHGVLHRDLKPQNIMVGPFGEVLVMDWGVAIRTDDGRVASGVAGTPGFMAPEQAEGKSPLDARSDIYALGVVLEAMLPEPPPKPLAAIARRAHANDPDARYADVRELADDIVRFREGHPVRAYRESIAERAGRIYQRHQLAITLMLVYMVVRIVLILWFRT